MRDDGPSSASVGPDHARGSGGPDTAGLTVRSPGTLHGTPDGLPGAVAEGAQQAQRMELLASLAGGVAHEFNNLLTVVLANLEPIGRGADERTTRRLTRATDAVRRAARLTQQVLAFTRRQHMDAEDVDLRDVLTGLEVLAGQAVGPAVRLVLELPDRPVPARLHVGQLELAVLHLVRAARAALPNGGELRAVLSDEADGPCILVGYVGEGATPEPAAVPPEPPSGTREPSPVIALGLSTARAFAERSGGSVQVSRVPGQGTHVALRLPRAGGKRNG